MRRIAFSSSAAAAAPALSESWLNLEEIAQVAVTSEDPDHRVEDAFRRGMACGWRAGGRGEQTIRLVFDPPLSLRRIWLRFSETERERTQEFSLRWGRERGFSREFIRQQWNFSPDGATTEIEDYRVELDRVAVLEFTIQPDIMHRDAVATLEEWRLA